MKNLNNITKYAVIHKRGEEQFANVYDTLEEANRKASDEWDHLTYREQRSQRVHVLDVQFDDLEDEDSWYSFNGGGHTSEYCFDSELIAEVLKQIEEIKADGKKSMADLEFELDGVGHEEHRLQHNSHTLHSDTLSETGLPTMCGDEYFEDFMFNGICEVLDAEDCNNTLYANTGLDAHDFMEVGEKLGVIAFTEDDINRINQILELKKSINLG